MNETNIIRDMLEEEHERNLRSQRAYEAEIVRFPRGSVTVRNRGNQRYCYLKYRDGEKIITEYKGRADDCEDELRNQVSQRKELEQALKRLRREQSYIEKALRCK